MAASNFASALTAVLAWEGGYSDRPDDAGGPTNLGITLATLSAWQCRRCVPADVRALTKADVLPIYAKRYWRPLQADDLPPGLDLLAFDGAVNQGVASVIRMIQRAAYVTADGQLGPASLKAVAASKPGDLIFRLQAERASEYRAAQGWPDFGKGWMRRLDGMAAEAFSWAAKEAPRAA